MTNSIKMFLKKYDIYNKTMKFSTMLLAMIFLFDFHLMPAVSALTVEEEAAKNRIKVEKRESSVSDRDLVPENRDRSHYDKVVKKRGYSSGPEKKDPRLACILSLIIPGSGHIYLRKDLKGIGFCLATATAYSATGYYLYSFFLGSLQSTDLKSKMILSGLLLMISIIIHVVAIVEAYNDAEDINKEAYYSKNDDFDDVYMARLEIE